jgi:transcriptional regulator GlxA family with amidase domain
MPAKHVVAVVLVEGSLLLDTAVALQAFGRRPTVFANIRDEDESPYDVILCGPPESSDRVAGLLADGLEPWSRIATADTVVAPGFDIPGTGEEPEVLDAIRAAAANGARLVALCKGAFLFGNAGVLDGHRVTTHWALADDFRSRYPQVDLHDEELYIDDGQVLSSGGMLAATDLCLHILRLDHGQAYANDVARMLVSPPHRTGGQAQYRTNPAAGLGGSLTPLLAWALEHLDEDLSLPILAAKAHLSTRTLSRRFEAETGRSAAQWVAERRVERARHLLEDTSLSVTEVAFATGFGSLASFRRQFTRLSGATPRAYRETFRSGAQPATAVGI